MKTIITKDSGIDPINEAHVIPAIVRKDFKLEYKDGIDITSTDVLKGLEEGHIYQTAAPSIEDYDRTFREALRCGDEVVHLSMSSGISEGSVNTANVMANSVSPEKISVIDTKTAATGGTLIDIYAEYLAKEGLSAKEIVKELEEYKKSIQTAFFVPNPIGFLNSGRDKTDESMTMKFKRLGLGALQKLGYKYRVDFNEEGNLNIEGMMRGTSQTKAMEMVQEIVNDDTIEKYDSSTVVLGTVAEGVVDMEALENYLKKYFNYVVRRDIGATVAAYGSKDLIGLSLKRKR